MVLCSKPFPRIQRKGEVSLTVADFQNYRAQVKFKVFYKISGTVLGKKDISIPSIPTVENFELG